MHLQKAVLPFDTFVRGALRALGDGPLLLIGSGAVEDVLRDPRVKAATLTGSEPAGASVAANAAKHIKKSVLELGGSDPFIVMPSADLGDAVSIGVKARIVNNGTTAVGIVQIGTDTGITLFKDIDAAARQVEGIEDEALQRHDGHAAFGRRRRGIAAVVLDDGHKLRHLSLVISG